jgi:hypothetical protein
MIDPICRAAFEHGREVVRRKRDAEARARFAAWERAKQRDYQSGFVQAASNYERAARTEAGHGGTIASP